MDVYLSDWLKKEDEKNTIILKLLKMEELRYLDRVLEELLESNNYQLTLGELKMRLVPEEKSDDGVKRKLVSVYEVNNITKRAIEYLRSEACVTLDDTLDDPLVTLEYRGIVKLKNKGFFQEVKDNNFKSNLNKLFWIASPIISFIALIVSIWAILEKSC